jgi:hypothetical protein
VRNPDPRGPPGATHTFALRIEKFGPGWPSESSLNRATSPIDEVERATDDRHEPDGCCIGAEQVKTEPSGSQEIRQPGGELHTGAAAPSEVCHSLDYKSYDSSQLRTPPSSFARIFDPLVAAVDPLSASTPSLAGAAVTAYAMTAATNTQVESLAG